MTYVCGFGIELSIKNNILHYFVESGEYYAFLHKHELESCSGDFGIFVNCNIFFSCIGGAVDVSSSDECMSNPYMLPLYEITIVNNEIKEVKNLRGLISKSPVETAVYKMCAFFDRECNSSCMAYEKQDVERFNIKGPYCRRLLITAGEHGVMEQVIK